jgi:tetratricopeptide (TPR) repeat protein
MYQKAEQEDPMYVDTYINMAEVYIVTKRLEEAKSVLQKVLFVDKNNGEVYFHLGNIAYMQQQPEEARSLYMKAVNNGYNEPRATYHLASLYLDMGDLDNALFFYGKSVKADPYNSAARLRKIEILVSQEKYEDALRNADELIEVRPDTFEGYHYKFITLLGLDRLEEGKRTLDQALELFPEDLGFVYDLIKYHEHKEEYDQALLLIDERFSPDKEGWYAILKEKAKILFTLQRLDEAKELFKKILDMEYDDEMCYCLMHLHAGYKEYEEVLTCCSKLIANQGDNDFYYSAVYYEAACYKHMGELQTAALKYEQALKTFRLACSVHPGNVVLYLYRALCYKELRQYDKAFEMLDYILKLTDGVMAEAYYVRSQLYTELGDAAKSKADMDKALGLNKMLEEILM